ncbi:MAG: hypothetical protein C4517_09340 [Stygiobacter sp.]|nr:MAG: hypothetical protein C4517_09340 [Stygiobacter sp.]
MHIERFSFSELEKQLDELSTDVEKIEYISTEVKKCKVAIEDVKYEADTFETMEIRLTIKSAKQETPLVEILNNDRRIRRTAIKKIMKLCARKLCRELTNYLKRAEVLLIHYKTNLDARVKSFDYLNCESKSNLSPDKTFIRIIWKLGKEKLLSLFVQLNLNEIVPKHSKEEILAHFTDEKQNFFVDRWGTCKKFSWYDSDCAFAVFVDELSKRGAIEDENKYKVFAQHFLNKQENSFKDLPQKRNYTENFTKTGDFIRKILDDAKI